MNREIKFRAWSKSTQKMMDWDFIHSVRSLHKLLTLEHVHVMQYTGLYDKNGKEIYEGDIIEYTQHHFNTEMLKIKRKVVYWKRDRWGIFETQAGESDIKVIGNIYENPELLEESKQ